LGTTSGVSERATSPTPTTTASEGGLRTTDFIINDPAQPFPFGDVTGGAAVPGTGLFSTYGYKGKGLPLVGLWVVSRGSVPTCEPPWESWRLPELESGGVRLF
jgi:hypothetical protein